MKLSLTSWSLPQCSLPEAVGLSKLLGIHALDLGYFDRSALDKKEILSNPKKMADRVLAFDIKVPCLYHLFGNNIADRNLALKDAKGSNTKDLQQIVLFCKKASIETIFILPGIVNPGQSIQDAMTVSTENLRKMVDICQKLDVTLAIEPHVHSYVESPELALEVLDKVPGLRLILDYAHFVCLGFTPVTVDVLIPFTQHVHLRQAKPGFLQTSLESGIINFPAVLGKLEEHAYPGYLAIEYVHQEYMNSLFNDVLSETIKMRDLVNRYTVNKNN